MNLGGTQTGKAADCESRAKLFVGSVEQPLELRRRQNARLLGKDLGFSRPRHRILARKLTGAGEIEQHVQDAPVVHPALRPNRQSMQPIIQVPRAHGRCKLVAKALGEMAQPGAQV